MTLEQFLEASGQRPAAFAAKIGVAASTVTRWLKGQRAVSAEMAVLVENATKGKVKRHQLRPDLWAEKRRSAA